MTTPDHTQWSGDRRAVSGSVSRGDGGYVHPARAGCQRRGRAYTTKTYTWYVSNNPVGTGEWYTGGRPSGVLVGQSWRLRVSVTDGVTTTSRELLVKESSSAPICAN